MLGFGRRERVTKEVAQGVTPLIRIFEVTDGTVPKSFWQDHYVLGYLCISIALLSKIASRGTIKGDDIGQLLIDVIESLSPGNGRVIVGQITKLNLNPTPEFTAGARAAEKVVTVSFGQDTFDHDPDFIRAREAVRKLGETDKPAGVAISGMMMNQLYYDVVRQRLSVGASRFG